ncbi:nucleotidyltransferase domain-containing protein [Epibacterium mobile]|nr:nucleotidyltransferase domain-containing protein [Tritonibacter mobilis]NHM24401.1 nucleotidyltransferase domain-containing protein [Tritonibacter mobilis]
MCGTKIDIATWRNHLKQIANIEDVPGEIKLLVKLCKTEMLASEVWLFGSRARGDNSPQSDFDILAVVPDDAPEDIDTPRAAYRLRRRSKAHADLLTARVSDFTGASTVPNTISYAVAQEGVRLDA